MRSSDDAPASRWTRPLRRLTMTLLLSMMVAAAAAGTVWAAVPTYSAPITITKGGTYTGSWESKDPDVPAVLVKTTAPVVIERCNVRGKDDLIKTAVKGARLTVRDCRGYGVNPGVTGEVKGRFVHAIGAGSLVIENNYLEGTTGIRVFGWKRGAPNATLKVRYNSAKNIDGRKSTGSGYSTDKKDGYVPQAQFLTLNNVHDARGVEIAWNQIVQVPNESRVGDTITFYGSGGNAKNPYLVHDNFIDGAFPVDPGSNADLLYSGGGIITDGPSSVTAKTVDQYIHIYDNQVIDSLNYGVKISQGHHNKLYGNVVVRDGVLSDGTVYASTSKVGDFNSGSGVALQNAKDQTFFGYNEVYGNKASWYDPRLTGGQRNFYIMSTCSTCVASDNVALSAARSADRSASAETVERFRWQDKLANGKVTVGPSTAN